MLWRRNQIIPDQERNAYKDYRGKEAGLQYTLAIDYEEIKGCHNSCRVKWEDVTFGLCRATSREISGHKLKLVRRKNHSMMFNQGSFPEWLRKASDFLQGSHPRPPSENNSNKLSPQKFPHFQIWPARSKQFQRQNPMHHRPPTYWFKLIYSSCSRGPSPNPPRDNFTGTTRTKKKVEKLRPLFSQTKK